MKKYKSEYGVKIFAYVISILTAIICFIPFWLIVIGSFTAESEVIRNGFAFWPKDFSMESYRMVFKVPEKIFRSYGITILITAVGTGLSLFLTTMAAFVLMRKDFKYRNQIAMFFYFPSIFSGGLLPGYLLIVNGLQLKDTLWALILPGLLGAWNIFMMRNFMTDIPDSIMESAKLDGANDVTILFRIMVPLSKASIATIALWSIVYHWNEWFNCMLYMKDEDKYVLQYVLRKILLDGQTQDINMATNVVVNTETMKMATLVVSILPIIMLYPFLQKYFAKGVMVGSVKG